MATKKEETQEVVAEAAKVQEVPAKTQRTFKAAERLGDLAKFEKYGDAVEGTLISVTEGATRHGKARFLQLEDDNGVKASVTISSNLRTFDWNALQNKYIRIEYVKDEKKAGSRQPHKVFNVLVAE